MLITPALYASESYYEDTDTVYSLSPIIDRKKIHIPAGHTLFYSNAYDPSLVLYPTSILKCKKLSGQGTIYIAPGNQLTIQADKISDFTGNLYCDPSASCIVYLKNVENVAFRVYGNPVICIQSKS